MKADRFGTSFEQVFKVQVPGDILARVERKLRHSGLRLAAAANALSWDMSKTADQRDVAADWEMRLLERHGPPDWAWYERELIRQTEYIKATGRIFLGPRVDAWSDEAYLSPAVADTPSATAQGKRVGDTPT